MAASKPLVIIPLIILIITQLFHQTHAQEQEDSSDSQEESLDNDRERLRSEEECRKPFYGDHTGVDAVMRYRLQSHSVFYIFWADKYLLFIINERGTPIGYTLPEDTSTLADDGNFTNLNLEPSAGNPIKAAWLESRPSTIHHMLPPNPVNTWLWNSEEYHWAGDPPPQGWIKNSSAPGGHTESIIGQTLPYGINLYVYNQRVDQNGNPQEVGSGGNVIAVDEWAGQKKQYHPKELEGQQNVGIEASHDHTPGAPYFIYVFLNYNGDPQTPYVAVYRITEPQWEEFKEPWLAPIPQILQWPQLIRTETVFETSEFFGCPASFCFSQRIDSIIELEDGSYEIKRGSNVYNMSTEVGNRFPLVKNQINADDRYELGPTVLIDMIDSQGPVIKFAFGDEFLRISSWDMSDLDNSTHSKNEVNQDTWVWEWHQCCGIDIHRPFDAVWYDPHKGLLYAFQKSNIFKFIKRMGNIQEIKLAGKGEKLWRFEDVFTPDRTPLQFHDYFPVGWSPHDRQVDAVLGYANKQKAEGKKVLMFRGNYFWEVDPNSWNSSNGTQEVKLIMDHFFESDTMKRKCDAMGDLQRAYVADLNGLREWQDMYKTDAVEYSDFGKPPTAIGPEARRSATSTVLKSFVGIVLLIGVSMLLVTAVVRCRRRTFPPRRLFSC